MTLTQYLCQLLSEECNELAQRASKLSRFGEDEIQKGQGLDNFERLRREKVDCPVFELLLSATGRRDTDTCNVNKEELYAKQGRIIEYTKLSVEKRQLEENILQELLTHSLYTKNQESQEENTMSEQSS